MKQCFTQKWTSSIPQNMLLIMPAPLESKANWTSRTSWLPIFLNLDKMASRSGCDASKLTTEIRTLIGWKQQKAKSASRSKYSSTVWFLETSDAGTLETETWSKLQIQILSKKPKRKWNLKICQPRRSFLQPDMLPATCHESAVTAWLESLTQLESQFLMTTRLTLRNHVVMTWLNSSFLQNESSHNA